MEPRDAAEVSVLIEQLGYQRDANEAKQWIERMQSRPNEQIAFVACLGEEVVGWIEVSIGYHLQSPPFALIGGLVVKEGFRSQQVGVRLCEEAEKWTWQQGLTLLRVTSRSSRIDAHRFYLKNGYAATKVSEVFEKKRPL